MGRFIIAWGVLERQLDGGIAILLQIDGTLSLCVSANLGTKAKVEMLMSAANMSGEAIGDDLADGAIACLRKISKMSGRFRNTLAHGQPSLWDVDDAPIWKWTRASAREFLDVATQPMSHASWDTAVVELKGLIEEFSGIWARIWSRLAALPITEREALYGHGERPV
jgi:hypothetical protein